MTLDDAWKIIAARGPAEVLVNRQGDTASQDVAIKQHRTPWDIIYIRDDGWSLGTSFYLAQYAEPMHKSRWIGKMVRGAKKPQAIGLDKT